jgi:hypothetical protein
MGDPPFPSHVVAACYRLRKVPIMQLGIEDLRLLIGQNIGLDYLMPIALEILQRDPWVSGDFYKSDLLQNVMRVGAEFWRNHQVLAGVLNAIFAELRQCQRRLQNEI